MISRICVKHIIPGIHKWPDAPATVGFLQSPHRHLFTYKLWFKVSHDDRDLEFFTLKELFQEWLDRMYAGQPKLGYNFKSRSCEHLAKEALRFHPNLLSVEVWEDDENGAVVTKEESDV